jgi:regulator of nucleoside diphosphate kinase
MKRLRVLLPSHDLQNSTYKNLLHNLKLELDRAIVVGSEDIPEDVVTMNSQTILTDLNTGEKVVCSLVFPGNADFDKNRISILAPVGTAILGCKVRDILDFEVPLGRTRLRIDAILYQPEAIGDYNL